MNRQEIITVARAWIGTPFHHQGRIKSVGVDCAGLIIGVAAEFGLALPDVAGYSAYPDGKTLQESCDRSLIKVAAYDVGDVLLFWITKRHLPSHIGFYSGEDRIIHAYGHEGVNRVCENIMGDWWHKRLVEAYQLPGVL